MFNLFGVGDNNKESNNIDVEILNSKDEILDEEVGQVALDVLETDYYVTIIAPIAGVELKDIDLYINKTILTIKGTREKPSEYFGDEVIIRNSECFWGKFIRNIILPENLSLNRIRAFMHNNTLIISIPKLIFDTKNIKINKVEG